MVSDAVEYEYDRLLFRNNTRCRRSGDMSTSVVDERQDMIHCVWCGARATKVIVRKSDGRKIPACRVCVSRNVRLEWELSRRPIVGRGEDPPPSA